jgi:hypothetical protein
VKKWSNRRIIVDSRDPIFKGGEDAFSKNFEKELATADPEAAEEVDRKIPDPLVDEMEITEFVDSDHAHDKMTRGRTPIFYQSKRQGAIETSTYGTEFCSMRTATEETIAVRYMLRCLGVKATHPTYMFGQPVSRPECNDERQSAQEEACGGRLPQGSRVSSGWYCPPNED